MESSSDEDSGLQEKQNSVSVLDMEDLGTIMNRAKKAKVSIKCLSPDTVLVGNGRSSGVDPAKQWRGGAVSHATRLLTVPAELVPVRRRTAN